MGGVLRRLGEGQKGGVTVHDRAPEIGEITARLSGLADELHLAAINAGIEAAKAGSNGKGFTAVSEQMMLLADQSKQATSELSTIVAEIGDAADR